MEDSGDLAAMFRRLILNTGPISVAHFMAESNARYYNAADPLGSAGDFITAPEISQMFGELIGLWLADIWSRAGKPEHAHYVELGPGRGTLARDALRAARQYGLEPRVHFVETSTALRDVQFANVPGVHWHDDLSSLPTSGPILLVANEFLDALPIRQLVKTDEGWRERKVGLEGTAESGRFIFVTGSQPMDSAVPEAQRNAEAGTIIESSPAAAAVIYEVAGRLAQQGGAALFIDYGHDETRLGSTLQAVRAHEKVSPFAMPGQADLTAHVDFAVLARVAQSRGAEWSGTVPQGEWLQRLGIEARAETLSRSAPEHADALQAAMNRLVDADQMGTLFKVMGLSAPEWPGGAGF
jgi:NADH dehydrogenase [ubiquinone] 1 alpha subcomplex assembly factor 7